MWRSYTPLSTLCCLSSFTKDAGKQPWTCSVAISLFLRVNSNKIIQMFVCVEKIFILLVQSPDKIADFKIFSEDRLLSSSNSERIGEQEDFQPSKLEESDNPGSRSYM